MNLFPAAPDASATPLPAELYGALYDQLHDTVQQLLLSAVARARHELALRKPPAGPASAPGVARAPLSEREREVLQRVAAGDSNKMIARALGLSPHTVKRHVANILAKVEARSRGQAVAWLLSQA